MFGINMLGAAGITALALGASVPTVAKTVRVASPDGGTVVVIDDTGQGPAYTLAYDGQTVLGSSALGFQFEAYEKLGPGMQIVAVEWQSGMDRYRLPAGRASQVSDAYNLATVTFAEPGEGGRSLKVEFRAYDDGAAFRYRLARQPGLDQIRLVNELTEFAFPADYDCWGFNVGHFESSHEGEFDPVAARLIRAHNRFDRPLTCTTGRNWFQITEADLHEYAGMYLTGRETGEAGVATMLSTRPDDPAIAVKADLARAPLVTPWRLIMLGDAPGAMLESTLVTSLNRPASGDFSWVKPGKYAWDWWNGPTISAIPNAGTNDATERALVDFASDAGLTYMLIDDGWYVNSGTGGRLLPGADATRPVDAINLPGLVAYAQEKGVDLWAWLHFKLLDRDMESVLGYLERTGIKGIKVDFMDRDDQQMVAFYDRLLAATADHHIMLNLHGAYPPTGAIRTYPNFLTQEAVLGAEYNKWTRRITAQHNVMLAYTRGALGPMDYTPGGFDNVSPDEFEPRVAPPQVQTTRGHALAMYVLFESPFQGVVDTPDHYRKGEQWVPGFAFLQQVPTVWDETRFLGGTIGQDIVVARRSGERWFIGAMTDDTARTLEVPLAFLNTEYRAEIWEDGDSPSAVRHSEQIVEPGGKIALKLAASGGAAIMLSPIE